MYREIYDRLRVHHAEHITDWISYHRLWSSILIFSLLSTTLSDVLVWLKCCVGISKGRIILLLFSFRRPLHYSLLLIIYFRLCFASLSQHKCYWPRLMAASSLNLDIWYFLFLVHYFDSFHFVSMNFAPKRPTLTCAYGSLPLSTKLNIPPTTDVIS